jgi:hypothetical protein
VTGIDASAGMPDVADLLGPAVARDGGRTDRRSVYFPSGATRLGFALSPKLDEIEGWGGQELRCPSCCPTPHFMACAGGVGSSPTL